LSANANTAGMTIAARAALFNAARSSTAPDDTSAANRGAIFHLRPPQQAALPDRPRGVCRVVFPRQTTARAGSVRLG
jgi:hypothetical protein